MSRTSYTAGLHRVLRFAARYGPGVSFGGTGADQRTRQATAYLLANGHLEGKVNNCRITTKGRKLLNEWNKTHKGVGL